MGVTVAPKNVIMNTAHINLPVLFTLLKQEMFAIYCVNCQVICCFMRLYGFFIKQ